MRQLHAITKWGKSYYKVGQVIYYKVGQSLLQTGQLFYKAGQILQYSEVHRPKTHQEVGQKNLLPNHTPFLCLLRTWTNEGTYLQIEPVWFENYIMC